MHLFYYEIFKQGSKRSLVACEIMPGEEIMQLKTDMNYSVQSQPNLWHEKLYMKQLN